MLDTEQFRKHGHKLIDWMADYLENVEKYPVKSQVKPRQIFDQLPKAPPTDGEEMEAILQDFQQIIMPGITHWQSPMYFAYFQANASYSSLLGEMLTSTLAAQCMMWETSPAAAELEEKVLNWLRDLSGLPADFEGVIQHTGSDSTLVALLTARELVTDFAVNESGFDGSESFRIYCSEQTHSSVEKGAKIAGFGRQNVIKIGVDQQFAMKADALRKAIEADLTEGKKPLCVVATLGTTGSHGMDPLDAIGDICQAFDIWLHVDAAHAGSAFILPEQQHWLKGIEKADSYYFNPHKWLFTHFDCSAYYVKDKGALIRTFEILPEYLKTASDSQVNNYRDWGIPLGRRFRALKLWFVMRSFGVAGLWEKIRLHISLAQEFADWVQKDPDFELLAPIPLNLVCFRYKPTGLTDPEQLNQLNAELLARLNSTGDIFLTHTKLNGIYTLRMSIGQTRVERKHVLQAWQMIKQFAEK